MGETDTSNEDTEKSPMKGLPYDEGNLHSTMTNRYQKGLPPNTSKLCPVQYGSLPKWFDDDDYNISRAATDFCHRNEIIRRLKRPDFPPSVIRYRIKRLEKHRIMKSHLQKTGGRTVKLYTITSKQVQSLIHNENESFSGDDAVKYKAHAGCFKSQIMDVNAPRPKGDKTYQPNNWKIPGEIFYYPTHTIRLTLNYAIVDINTDLPPASKDKILLKLHTLAISYLGKFSEQHGVSLSSNIEVTRRPHVTIEGSDSLAKDMLDTVGASEIYFKDKGVQIDSSDVLHKGELEFTGEKGMESLTAFDFALNRLPILASSLKTDMEQVKGKLEKVNNSIQALESALALSERVKAIESKFDGPQEETTYKSHLISDKNHAIEGYT